MLAQELDAADEIFVEDANGTLGAFERVEQVAIISPSSVVACQKALCSA